MPYVDVNGVATYYEVEGEGAPLLLLHGGLVPIESLQAQRVALAPQFQVWLPERRGHGRTHDVQGPYGYEQMTADTVAFMAALEISQADVVGHSDGAIAGLLLALRHPEQVRRLVAISGNFDPSGVLPDEEVPERGRSGEAVSSLSDMYARLSPDGPEHFDVVREKVERMQRTEPRLTPDDMAAIRAPTLVMAGDADAIRLEHTIELFRAIPDARLAIVADAGHDLIASKPEIVNATILDFLGTDAHRGRINDEIRYSTFVRAPRERVYDAFTTSEGLDAWFTSGASVDARPGGELVWRWRHWGPARVTATDSGPVLEARRPERFVFRWHDGLPAPTTVELDFEERDRGTIVRLRDHGYGDDERSRAAFVDCAAGWGEALTLLKFYVEHGIRY